MSAFEEMMEARMRLIFTSTDEARRQIDAYAYDDISILTLGVVTIPEDQNQDIEDFNVGILTWGDAVALRDALSDWIEENNPHSG